jgi:methanogenic corrinoid protein MtbC1
MYISLLEGFVKAVVDLDESKALELTRKRLEVGEDPLKILDDLTRAANIIGK